MQLLTRVTAALRLTLRKGVPPQDRQLVTTWQVGQPRPFMVGNILVIPAFNDGHIILPASFLVQTSDHHIIAITQHSSKIFTCPRQAVEFAISV